MGYLDHRVIDQSFARSALAATRLSATADEQSLFDLGCACSTGTESADCDMVEAHKWFNLAALRGHEMAHVCRAEVAEELTAREIAEAQRRARAWLSETSHTVS